MMVERGEKTTFSDQILATVNDLPKPIRIIDNKKLFTENQKNIIEIGPLPELCLCSIIRNCAFLIHIILNHWFYWLIPP